jgi:ABC-2 type transport system ATP-binding protein
MSPPSELAIQITGLTKSYGPVQALYGIDLSVRRGEVFGFLGPNGAGKTTTIRCLIDVIRPTSGSVRVLGIDPQVDPVAVRRQIGYLPGELHLEDNLTSREVLELFDSFRGGTADWGFILKLAERLQLDLDRPIKQFSKGNKQKVGVVQAFMHRPPLLLLDEPTSGLDPLMQHEVMALVREANEAGATVFFSSHVLGEVEAVCGRVAIVRKGLIVEVTETEHLTRRSFRYVSVRFRDERDGERLKEVPGVKALERKADGWFRMRVEGETGPLVSVLAGLSVVDLETERPTLEQVFLTYYEEQ